MGEVTIRPADIRDTAGLAHAWIEFGRYYETLDPDHFRVPEWPGLEEWFASFLREEPGPDQLWLVAVVDDDLIGYVMAEISNPNSQLLRDVYVKRLSP